MVKGVAQSINYCVSCTELFGFLFAHPLAIDKVHFDGMHSS